jgi:D-alanyl-D-alanine endopeptidase (penicillin-binding protein 7)
MLKFFLIFFIFTNISWAKDQGTFWIYNSTQNQIIGSSLSTQQKPIASITKLMTALLVVESKQPLDTKISYQGWIWQKKSVSRHELLESLLIRSDNAAAESLAASWAGGRKEFIIQMNRKAKELGMTNTRFDDPSGLSSKNISTAEDISKLILASARHEIIKKVSVSKYVLVERDIKQRINQIEIPNTNQGLLFEFDSIILSKTGFTNKAGWCLALMVEKSNQNYIIVILGEPSPQSRADKARHLINNYVKIQEKDDYSEDRFYLFNF